MRGAPRAGEEEKVDGHDDDYDDGENIREEDTRICGSEGILFILQVKQDLKHHFCPPAKSWGRLTKKNISENKEMRPSS